MSVAANARFALLAGNYGAASLAPGSTLVLGTANSPEPIEYFFHSLALGSGAVIEVAGPVVVTVAQGVSIANVVGNPEHPSWLKFRVASGVTTLAGNAAFAGDLVAPTGSVAISGNATLTGSVVADRLAINGNGLVTNP